MTTSNMPDEQFEIWWKKKQLESWKRGYPNGERGECPPEWGIYFKIEAMEAFKAGRASLAPTVELKCENGVATVRVNGHSIHTPSDQRRDISHHFGKATSDHLAVNLAEPESRVEASKFSPHEIALDESVIDVIRKENANWQPNLLEGWTKWNGDCPIPAGVAYYVQFRNGNNEYSTDPFDFSWSHNGSGGDIIAYRISSSETK